MQPQPVKTPAQVAALFGCTIEQARAQMTANAAGLRKMEAKARATGKKHSGFTADQLAERAGAFERAAAQ